MNKGLVKLVQNSMFVVISLVFSLCINFPISVAFPFIKFDIADVPIFLSTLIFGVHYGITAFIATLILRTLFLSSAGIVGFLIRFSSICVIVSLEPFHKNPKYNLKNISIILVGMILSLCIKLPISYILWRCLGLEKTILDMSFFTFITPFNFIKYILNVALALILYKKVSKLVKKHTVTIPQ